MLKFRKLMTRGLAIAAITAVAGLGAMTLGDAPALAAHGGGHGGGHGGHAGSAHFAGHGHVGGGHVGRGGGRIVVRGGGRRFWHGRWWGPGIGPCWRWTPLGWVWICG